MWATPFAVGAPSRHESLRAPARPPRRRRPRLPCCARRNARGGGAIAARPLSAEGDAEAASPRDEVQGSGRRGQGPEGRRPRGHRARATARRSNPLLPAPATGPCPFRRPAPPPPRDAEREERVTNDRGFAAPSSRRLKGRAEHRGHANDVQRRRPNENRRHGAAQGKYKGRLSEKTARHEARFNGVLLQGPASRR